MRLDVLNTQTKARAVVRTAAGCDQVLAPTLGLERAKVRNSIRAVMS